MPASITRKGEWNTLAKINSVLLGDNPFFGVDHLSQERAREKADRSQNFNNALQVVKYCFESGANGMVVSTHPKLKDLLDLMKSESGLINKIDFFPILPYVQGYVIKINEKGMINTLTETLSQTSLQNKLRIIAKGGIGILKKDFNQLFKLFVDIELLQINNGTKIKAVFLHDVLTDLALSLKMRNIFEMFQEHLHDRYNIQAGLVTKNFSLLTSALQEWNLRYPFVMTSFNKVGFQMNPSRQECENALSRFNGKVIAMSVFAGGYVKPKEAYEYILSLPNVDAAVIGISSVDHAKDTLDLFRNGKYTGA
jgi:hypothetical protein